MLDEEVGEEFHCNVCSCDISAKARFTCLKAADFDLCEAHYEEGCFPPGMCSADFARQLGPACGRAGGLGECEYVLDAMQQGGVARFINHSCEPNLFIQPVLSHHRDGKLPRLCLFTSEAHVSAMTELTYDYGQAYVREQLGGKCRCGALSCVSAGNGGNAAAVPVA